MIKSSYAVTFEFDTRPPQTHRGTVSGGRAALLMAKAVKEAQLALSPVHWDSCVCVLLDRKDGLEGKGLVAPDPKVAERMAQMRAKRKPKGA